MPRNTVSCTSVVENPVHLRISPYYRQRTAILAPQRTRMHGASTDRDIKCGTLTRVEECRGSLKLVETLHAIPQAQHACIT